MHVLTGGTELTVDNHTQVITTGDVIHCVGNEVFSMKNNTNENLSCFVVIAPRPTAKAYAQEFGNKYGIRNKGLYLNSEEEVFSLRIYLFEDI